MILTCTYTDYDYCNCIHSAMKKFFPVLFKDAPSTKFRAFGDHEKFALIYTDIVYKEKYWFCIIAKHKETLLTGFSFMFIDCLPGENGQTEGVHQAQAYNLYAYEFSDLVNPLEIRALERLSLKNPG
jgi:hypothetical protein